MTRKGNNNLLSLWRIY